MMSRLTQDAQKKTNLFVKSLRRRPFFEAVILIFRDDRFAEVHQHFASEQVFR